MIWGILIVLIVVCLGFLAWLFCIAPASPRGDFAEMKKYDYAHRGLHEKDLSVPENSMAGFKAAVEAGYGIEFDLQLTKDKKVVVHHDRSLKRVCGADVSIGDLTYKELQQYRLQNTEERVPLFSDVLALVDGRTPLIIELKHYDDADLLCPLVWELLRNYKGPYCVESQTRCSGGMAARSSALRWKGLHRPSRRSMSRRPALTRGNRPRGRALQGRPSCRRLCTRRR